MDTTTLVVIGVIVLLVIFGLFLIARRSGRMRRPDLRPLSAESHDRYVSQWERIERRFVDAPDEAVKQADALILAMLVERGHPLAPDQLPFNLRKARREAIGQEGKGGTEGMRQAILHYRTVVEEYAGRADERSRTPEGRPEIAP